MLTTNGDAEDDDESFRCTAHVQKCTSARTFCTIAREFSPFRRQGAACESVRGAGGGASRAVERGKQSPRCPWIQVTGNDVTGKVERGAAGRRQTFKPMSSFTFSRMLFMTFSLVPSNR
jgi:hypothetical protein